MPALEIHTSEPIHYRMRAEFTIWHEGEDLYFVMFDTTKGECMPVFLFRRFIV